MSSSTYLRVALLTLVAMAAAAVPILWGSHSGMGTMFNAPLRWIPHDSPARAEFNRFLTRFAWPDIALLSWPGCTVDDPRLQEVADALTAESKRRAAAGEPPLLGQVVTGYGMLRTLMQPPSRLPRAEALRQMKGALVGPDGQTSCAAVALTDYGSVHRRPAIGLVLDTVKRVTGFARKDLRLAGPTIDGIATDDESIRSLRRYSLPSILISLVLCCLCLRSIWLTLPILAVGALGQGVMLASVYYLGMTMNAVLIVLPPLVFVLTVSAGVHLVNYFYDELRTGPVDGATTRALSKGWGPCALAATTTAIGLASLAVSSVQPVRQFGALAAAGVLLTVLLLFLLLPGAMEAMRFLPGRRGQAGPPPALPDRPARRDIGQVAAAMIDRYSRWISSACLMLLVVCGAGLMWLHSSINVVSLLAPENRAVQDFRWFENHLGPLVTVEVVIHFDPRCALDSLRRLELVRSVQHDISKIDILDGAMSAASFFPAIPKPGGFRGTARRVALRRSLERSEEELIAAQYLHVADDGQAWRISARIFGLENFDHRRFLDQLRRRVAPLIAKYQSPGAGNIRATYTGVTAVVYEAEKTLLADLFDSFLTALACVTLVMMLALRGFRAGLLAMVPNIFPTLILFGTMGWLGRAVDIGTVMTASVALGIAVDGTFHFLKWFRHEVELGRPCREAVAYSYRHCGRALVQTTVICACGLLVFALSGFLPARYFAVRLLLLMLAALVGDLIVLPALLVGPMGRFFVPGHPSNF